MTDLVLMLRKIENLKFGDPMPPELGPGEWGKTLSKLCGDAANEIESLHRVRAIEYATWCDDLRNLSSDKWGSSFVMNSKNWP